MDLSIIIVSWNVEKLLIKNLEAIFNYNQGISFEIFVVDNNSTDNTVESIRKIFPQIKLIENSENLGFAKANNIAIKRSIGRYVLLLNPDMRVCKNTLKDMVKWMDNNKNIGVGGCKLINKKEENIKHIRRFPTLFDQSMIILKVPHLFPGILNKYIINDFNYSKEGIVDSIRGSFFMIRKKVINKIGLLDENFFIWFEEVDYCKRVYFSKWNVVYNPEVKCYDYVGKSFSQVRRNIKQKYFKESMLKYFKKWQPKWQYNLLKIFWFIVYKNKK